MEEKKLTEKESLDLITEMIRNTKRRLELGDGNLMLLWGYTSVFASVAVYLAGLVMKSPAANIFWVLIPAIGLPAMMLLRRKGVKISETYVDQVSNGLWKLVRTTAFIALALCIAFALCGYDAWVIMWIYALFVIGFATAAQGIIIREKSLAIGGLFGVAAGGFSCCCAVCGIPILAVWGIPLFILNFIAVLIIPGHCINRKAKMSCSKN